MNLKSSIVQILYPDKTTSGTGFLCSDSGLIITCSHVIISEEEQAQGKLSLPPIVRFQFLAEGYLNIAFLLCFYTFA